MLNTDACIDIIRGKRTKVESRLAHFPPDTVSISAITLAELQHGVEKSANPVRNQNALHQFCVWLDILPFNTRCAAAYGQLRANLEREGRVIGPMDMLIAAHAISTDCTLVTGNTRVFRRVKGLSVESW